MQQHPKFCCTFYMKKAQDPFGIAALRFACVGLMPLNLPGRLRTVQELISPSFRNDDKQDKEDENDANACGHAVTITNSSNFAHLTFPFLGRIRISYERNLSALWTKSAVQ
ncbi:hypothetical protein CJP46_32130 [Paenibacillus sp. XY044]|nr:hypothetical protein CJP46_32130 [Paenibacillus sp. XY044]